MKITNFKNFLNPSESRYFGFWGNLPLSRKLLLAFGILFVFAVIIAVIALFGSNRTQAAYEDTLAQGIEMRSLSNQLATSLLQARDNERNFLLYWRDQGFDRAYSNYVTLHMQHVADMREDLKQLAPFGPVAATVSTGDITQAQYEADIASLTQNVDAYEKSFTALVEAHRRKGFDEPTDFESQFRVAANRIYMELFFYRASGVEQLQVNYLRLRSSENNYLAYEDQQYIVEVHNFIPLLKDEFATSDQFDPAKRTEMLTQADAYLTAFDGLVVLDKKIAVYNEELINATSAVESLTAKIENLGKQLAIDGIGTARLNSAQTFTVSIITVVIVLVLTIFISITLSQQITRPITSLTNTAEKIASGNFDTQAEVTSTDEVGTLAETFNNMSARLRRSFEDVRHRALAIQTSAEVSRRLSTILNRKELVTEVVDQVKDAFGYYHTQIYFYDEANEKLVMAGGTGEAGETMLAQGHKIPKGRGLVGRAAESNEAVLVSDTLQNSEWLPNPLLPDTKSEAAIPISIGEQVLGVLDVQDNITDGLQQQDVDSLQSIANQVAVALQNIRQYETTQKIAADMETVANLGISTSTITEIGLLLQEMVDLSKKSFNLYHAHIYLLNQAGDTLELSAGAGEVGRQMVAEKRSIPLNSEHSLVARAARTQKGVVVNDVTAAPDFLPNPLLPDTRSEMAVPMIVAGKVIGVLDVQSETANHFTEVDVSIQTTLASQVAVALQNARSFSQSQRQSERETAVNLITQKIQNTTTIEAALQIAVRELGHALGMKSTQVTLDLEALADEHKGN